VNLANWVKQSTTTVGVGNLVLGNTINGYIAVSSAFIDGDRVFYTLYEGSDRENGLGTYLAGSTSISRDVIFETLVEGVYSNPAAGAINLNGFAVVTVTPTTQGLTTHLPVWKDLTSNPAWNASGSYAQPPMVVFSGNILLPAFSAGTMQEMAFSFTLNNDINVGSNMYPHIEWSPDDTDTGDVRWGMEYTIAEQGSVFAESVTVYLLQAANGAIKESISAEFAALVAPLPDTIIQGRIFRDAANIEDTYTGNAVLHAVNLHYLASALGTPSRAPDYYSWT
jgi:hypothetical protein